MDNEVKPTWSLAWGLWWRMLLIGLGISAVITLIVILVSWAFVVSLLGGFLGAL